MTNKQSANAKIAGDQSLDLESYIEAFESELSTNGDANVEDFLPHDAHPDYHEIVVELLRVDFEHRWQRGQLNDIDAYLEPFAATLSNDKRLEPLAFEAYRLNCQAGVETDPKSYAAKYQVNTSSWPAPSQLTNPSTRKLPSAANDEAWPMVGDDIADFKLIAEFGRGSFSRVYLAQQGKLANRLVVLKASKRFWKESDLLARLQHTNIVPIHSVHMADDTQIVCMPFWGTCTLADVVSQHGGDLKSALSRETFQSTVANLQNETVVSVLRQHSKSGRESASTENQPQHSSDKNDRTVAEEATQTSNSSHYIDTCISLAEQIAEGLSHAHQRGIIHGDLKPANVLIADDGRPMILDFNLSVDVADDASSAGVGGTIAYMSPEHLRKMNGEPVDRSAASDVYSLGVILFELIAGVTPFPDRGSSFENAFPKLIQDREQRVPTLRSVSPDVPRGVDAILAKCLAPRLEDRYASADQLLEDLRRHSRHQPLKHVAEPIGERIRKLHRSKPKLLYGVLATLALVLATSSLVGLARSRAKSERLEAQATHNEFVRDMDGLLSGIGTSRIDLKDSETVRQQAQNWLATLDTMRWSQLTRDQTAEHKRLAGELLLTLARTKLDATYSDPEQREAALAEAGKLLARAKPFLPGSTYAWNSLAEEIDTARGGEVTSAHERTSPVTALDFETLGDSKLRHGQLTTAINAYRHANDLSPGNYSTWLKLGNAYREQLSWEDAERSFSRCIQLRRDLPVGYLHRLVTRLELRDFDGAVRDADRFMELKPDNVAGYFNRALAYRGLRDHQQAERDLTRAIELAELSDFGAEPRFFLLRSELRHALNDREGADADHDHGLNLVPFDEANFLARGMAHLKDKNPKQALQDFRAALNLNRNSVSALKNIAYVLSDFLNDNRQAIKTLKMALQARPTDAELRGSLAVLEAREGNSDSARSAIHQALKTDQTAPTLIRAASVYSLTQNGRKDQDQAIEFLQRALATKPLWARYVQGDPDLKAIHANKQFQELIGAANRLLP